MNIKRETIELAVLAVLGGIVMVLLGVMTGGAR